jgi:probable F420-dependent oxidoreductase
MDRLGMTVPVAGETMAELPAVLDELAAAGYTDIWTSEVNATDAFAPLLMAAQRVPRLRLGTSIAGVFSRSPALMAMSALAVAELSDQPVYVGVGTSSQNMVEQWHGTAFVRPYQRVRDTVRFLRAAFAGDRVTFQGDTFEIDGFRLGRVPPHPPRILVAALREGMLRLAGRESDGVVLNWLSPDDTARVVPLVLDGNPDADVVARLFVVTGPDRDTARGLARRMVTAYLNTGVYAEYQRWLGRGPALEAMWAAWQAGDRRGALTAVPDSVIDELFVIGSPAEIRSGVADYVRAGITIPVLAVLAPDGDSIRKLAVELGRNG